MKKKKNKSGLTMALTVGGEPVIVGTKFKDWLVRREEMAKEGHAYLRQSGPDWIGKRARDQQGQSCCWRC